MLWANAGAGVPKEETMRKAIWLGTAILVAALVLLGTGQQAFAQQKKIVYWTHWEQNPDFN
jgi:hypothetical protein